MKTPILILAVLSTVLFTACKDNSSSSSSTELVTHMDSVSYAIGHMLAVDEPFKSFDSLNPIVLASAMQSIIANGDTSSKLTTEEAIMLFRKHMTDVQIAKAKKIDDEGKAFLAENMSKEGVKTLPSGLQYRIIREGTGKSPGPNDSVSCHYKGSFIDGEVFNSSYERGTPVDFNLKYLIKGWSEGMQMMKEGGKGELFVPASLAYGAQGRTNPQTGEVLIAPNSVLIFEVELLKVY
jgi:FKBP-type peptidyl-prolyl cis-trans isomerase FklB